MDEVREAFRREFGDSFLTNKDCALRVFEAGWRAAMWRMTQQQFRRASMEHLSFEEANRE